jgi:hypothetical protein
MSRFMDNLCLMFQVMGEGHSQNARPDLAKLPHPRPLTLGMALPWGFTPTLLAH